MCNNLVKELYLKDKNLAVKVAKVYGCKIISKKVTNAELKKLIKLYAIKIYSNKEADLKTAQIAHDRFMKYYNKMTDKSPEYDLSSATFWSLLKNKAKNYWSKLAMKGPGVHW